MSAIGVSHDWFRNFVSTHKWVNGEIVVYTCGGSDQETHGYNMWHLAYSIEADLGSFVPNQHHFQRSLAMLLNRCHHGQQ